MRLIDSMHRSDKKNTICAYYEYKFIRPVKLWQHYQSKKNQCNLSSEISNQKESWKKANIPRPHSPSPAPVIHIRRKDCRKEKLQTVIPIPDFESEPQKSELVEGQDYITEEEAKNWVNQNARKPKT